MEREELAEFVDQGMSTWQMAEATGRSQTNVRYWLRRHGLQTRQATRRPPADGTTTGFCPTHGETEFGGRQDGRWRCLRCRSEHVSDRRRRIKRLLVEEAGGRCTRCGYDRCLAALHFHHTDPTTKRFHLGGGGYSLSLEKAREEVAKCELVCANCHAEQEAGLATLTRVPT